MWFEHGIIFIHYITSYSLRVSKSNLSSNNNHYFSIQWLCYIFNRLEAIITAIKWSTNSWKVLYMHFWQNEMIMGTGRDIWPPWRYIQNVICGKWQKNEIDYIHNSAFIHHTFTVSTFKYIFCRIGRHYELVTNSLFLNSSIKIKDVF